MVRFIIGPQTGLKEYPKACTDLPTFDFQNWGGYSAVTLRTCLVFGRSEEFVPDLLLLPPDHPLVDLLRDRLARRRRSVGDNDDFAARAGAVTGGERGIFPESVLFQLTH